MFADRRASSLREQRHRQPWPADRRFRILSLDGGGIRGLYAAHILQRCEAELTGGRLICEYFDMIAGTSTGGIIAIALGLRFPTNEIVDLYTWDGRRIFPPLPTTWPGRKWRSMKSLGALQLDYRELETALKRRFENRLFGECQTRTVVPAFMMPKTEIAVFKTDHHADFENDWRSPAWRVARATSAAPTYLAGLEDEPSGKIFIDGGVWANNPIMVAIIDAMTSYAVSPNQIEVVSIGTGNAPFELKRRNVFGGLVSWKKIINAAMFLTTDNATAQAMLLLGPQNVVRLEPQGESAAIDLDDYDRALATMPALADADFGSQKEQLSRFFIEPASARERHYSARP